jgi:uncharacterized protein YhaN
MPWRDAGAVTVRALERELEAARAEIALMGEKAVAAAAAKCAGLERELEAAHAEIARMNNVLEAWRANNDSTYMERDNALTKKHENNRARLDQDAFAYGVDFGKRQRLEEAAPAAPPAVYRTTLDARLTKAKADIACLDTAVKKWIKIGRESTELADRLLIENRELRAAITQDKAAYEPGEQGEAPAALELFAGVFTRR